MAWQKKITKKIPMPRTGDWMKEHGSWEGFCAAISKSTGGKIELGVVSFAEGF